MRNSILTFHKGDFPGFLKLVGSTKSLFAISGESLILTPNTSEFSKSLARFVSTCLTCPHYTLIIGYVNGQNEILQENKKIGGGTYYGWERVRSYSTVHFILHNSYGNSPGAPPAHLLWLICTLDNPKIRPPFGGYAPFPQRGTFSFVKTGLPASP